MKYNFDEIVDRSGSNCLKWDLAEEGVLPLWVADMDFKAAPCILSSLQKRLDHGIFGYTIPPQRYFDAVINWFGRRHGLEVRKEWMLQTPGVLPGVSASIKAVSNPGDKVLILPPVYNHFYCSIRHCNCVAC